MKKINPQTDWPESWKLSYSYDCNEVYGEVSDRGYANHYAERQRHVFDLVEKLVQPGSKVLDVAAAQGNFSLALAEKGYEVTWNDIRKDLADYVKMKQERGMLHFTPGNIFEAKFAKPFQLVLVNEMLEHVAHPDQLLEKIKSFVAPRGYVILTTPNGEYFLNHLPKFSDCPAPSEFEAKQFKPSSEDHIFLLWEEEIKTIANQIGMEFVEARVFANPLTNGNLKTRYLLKILPEEWVKVIERKTVSLPNIVAKKIHSGMIVVLQNV